MSHGSPFFGAELILQEGNKQIGRYVVSVGATPLVKIRIARARKVPDASVLDAYSVCEFEPMNDVACLVLDIDPIAEVQLASHDVARHAVPGTLKGLIGPLPRPQAQ